MSWEDEIVLENARLRRVIDNQKRTIHSILGELEKNHNSRERFSEVLGGLPKPNLSGRDMLEWKVAELQEFDPWTTLEPRAYAFEPEQHIIPFERQVFRLIEDQDELHFWTYDSWGFFDINEFDHYMGKMYHKMILQAMLYAENQVKKGHY